MTVKFNQFSISCFLGFTLEKASKNCFMALNMTTNYWSSLKTSCKNLDSQLIDFDDEQELRGVIGLLEKGIFYRVFCCN